MKNSIKVDDNNSIIYYIYMEHCNKCIEFKFEIQAVFCN